MRPYVHLIASVCSVVLAVTMTASASPAQTAGAAFSGATDLMTAAGCTSPRTIPAQNGAIEMGRCFLSGGEIGVATFANSSDRDAWVNGAVDCDGGCIVVGPTWVAVGVNAALARRLMARLGGWIA